jgi:hypothetical protein
MRKINLVSYLLFVFLIWACSSSQPPAKKLDFLKNSKLSMQQKFRILLQNGHPDLALSNLELQQLKAYYEARSFQRIHTSDSGFSAIGLKWKKTLERQECFGLTEQRQLPSNNKNLLIQELILTYNLGTAVRDLDSGFIDFENEKLKPKKWQAFPETWATSLQNTDSLLLSRGPLDSNYRFFAQHLYHFRDTAHLDSISYILCTEKKDKQLAWLQLKKALLGMGSITPSTDSLGIRGALKSFQSKQGLNPDGRIGEATVLAVAESSQTRFDRAIIALDRLRQAKVRPKKFIAINIPSFSLIFVADDTLRSRHNIIVGKMDHPTPTLESRVYRIVSLPYWKVPSSIAKKEILPALKRNRSYLSKEHMRIYKANKVEVNPSAVNWKKVKDNTFPYQIIQDPGPWNSLGLIKFEFANNFSVYVHDTPSRSLFKQAFRSFSHGCMRCEAPIELGKQILSFDQKSKRPEQYNLVTPDSLQTLIDQSIHQEIKLHQGIPIFIAYSSVTADRDGLYFYLDLYQKEQKLLRLLRTENNG